MNWTEGSKDRLPRRDWFLLPLVVLGVTAIFLGASYLVADHMFPEGGRFTCNTWDRLGFVRQKPNCVCHYKNAEGPLVEYRFNECGYRSTISSPAKNAAPWRVPLIWQVPPPRPSTSSPCAMTGATR